MDLIDKKLCNILQVEFPLHSRPFEFIGERLGLTHEEVLHRVKSLYESKIVRRIAVSIAPAVLGYNSTLIACKIEPLYLETTIEKINKYHEITHNYERDHDFNVWFTIIAPNHKRISEILEQIRAFPGVLKLLDLPSLRQFKIDVFFDFEKDSHSQQVQKEMSPKQINLTSYKPFIENSLEWHLLKFLQKGIEVCPEPFAQFASMHKVTVEKVVEVLSTWKKDGILRKFGAFINHYAAQFVANGMTVFAVESKNIQGAGEILASYTQVSHCYARLTYNEWPYSLYAMIHGDNQINIKEIAKSMSVKLGNVDYQVLFSKREFKKSSWHIKQGESHVS